MTAWKMNPQVMALNAQARNAISDRDGARAIVQAIDNGTPLDSPFDTREEAVANYEECVADAREAVRKALDAILPMLDETEREIFDTRLEFAYHLPGHAPSAELQLWMLQNNDEYFKVTFNAGTHAHDFWEADPMYETLIENSERAIYRVRSQAELEKIESGYPEGLRAARVARGMTVTGLAKEAGISRSQLQQMERTGLQDSKAGTVKRLAEILGVDMEDLLK